MTNDPRAPNRHVPFTRTILEKWAGKQMFQQGLALFERKVAEKVVYDPPFVTGQLAVGTRGLRCKFEVLPDGFVENHCPCRDNKENGLICSHLVAIGLEAVRLYSDPLRMEKQLEEKRRAERLAEFDDAAFHTRVPPGTPGAVPAVLRITLKQSWREELASGEISLRFGVESGGKNTPLNEVSKKIPLAFNAQDDNLLFVIEDICEGPAKGKITARLADFANLLELCAGKEIYEGGRDGCLMVDNATVPTRLAMRLDGETGELVLTVRTASEEPAVFIVGGGFGWVLADGLFSKLGNLLPRAMHMIYQAPVRIPREAIPAFMKQELPVLQNAMPVETDLSDDLLTLRPATPRFRLAVEGDMQALSAKLYAEYGAVRLTAGREEAAGHFALPSPDDLLEFQVRNTEAEKTALEKLQQTTGFRGIRGDMLAQVRGAREVLNFLGAGLPRLRRMGWRVDIEGIVAGFMDQAEFTTPVVHIRPAPGGAGFFDVGYEYDNIGGKSLDESDIQRAINMGEAFVQKKGRTVLIDIDAIETARNVFSDCATGPGASPGSFRMGGAHSAYVQSALQSLDGVDVEAPPQWLARAQEQNRSAKLQPEPLGEPLEGILRDYQKHGVYWLRYLERSGFCGLLADEMGLGKTLQTLTWLSLERQDGDARGKPSLIVCPTSLVENWAEEAAKFTPGLKVVKMHGADRHDRWEEVAGANLVVTSYALIRRDLAEYLKHEFAIAVLDEAQHIKNRTTQNAEAVKQLRALHKLVLTGTPIENSVADLWSIMDFLMPGYLGSHQVFRAGYELPIQQGGAEAEQAKTKLRRKLHPFLMRRLKRDVAKDLPEKIERVAHCALSKDQHMVYRQLLESAKKKINDLVGAQGFNQSRMEILAILLKLRQTCCHLDLLKLPGLKSEYPSAKMELFFELVDEALDAGHRILVFSQFTSMLAILREELEARGLKYCYLDGSTQDRQARVRQFNTDRSIPLFLISLKAGGSGLNLTGADMVIHFDPWWNPAVENQATDRAHRIGQKNTVYSVKLITKNSVEEKVLQMQQRKKSVIDATLEQEGSFEKSLSFEDVKELLSV